MFAILAPVLFLFDILVVLQIALGAYSLWDGYQWFAHGPAAPRLARGILCARRGGDLPLQRPRTGPGGEPHRAHALRLPNYEIYFSLATSLDPALKIIERVKAASQRPVHIVIAGPPENCGEKVYNLVATVESLPAKFEVIVFTDSDVRLPRDWLTKLVAPLQDPRIGATTAYRWIIPSRGAGRAASRAPWPPPGTLRWPRYSAARAKISAGAAARRSAERLSTMRACSKPGMARSSDDFALTNALEAAGKPIVFCPECLAATLHPWTGSYLARIHQPPNPDHARLFAPPMAAGRRRAPGLFAHARSTPPS